MYPLLHIDIKVAVVLLQAPAGADAEPGRRVRLMDGGAQLLYHGKCVFPPPRGQVQGSPLGQIGLVGSAVRAFLHSGRIKIIVNMNPVRPVILLDFRRPVCDQLPHVG